MSVPPTASTRPDPRSARSPRTASKEGAGPTRHHAGFEPHDIGEGWVLGVEKDDLGLETVRMCTLLTGR